MANTNQLVHAFIQYWHGSVTRPTGDLAKYIQQWRMFHLQKALIFLLITIIFAWFSWYILKNYVLSSKNISSKGKFLSVLELFSSLGAFLGWIVVVANVQGLLYPYSSLMTKIIPSNNSSAQRIFRNISNQIKNNTLDGKAKYLLTDFQNYHLVIGILGILTFALLMLLVIYLFKQNRQRQLATLNQVIVITMITIFGMLLLTDLVVTIANFGTYFNPDNALISALAGDF